MCQKCPQFLMGQCKDCCSPVTSFSDPFQGFLLTRRSQLLWTSLLKGFSLIEVILIDDNLDWNHLVLILLNGGMQFGIFVALVRAWWLGMDYESSRRWTIGSLLFSIAFPLLLLLVPISSVPTLLGSHTINAVLAKVVGLNAPVLYLPYTVLMGLQRVRSVLKARNIEPLVLRWSQWLLTIFVIVLAYVVFMAAYQIAWLCVLFSAGEAWTGIVVAWAWLSFSICLLCKIYSLDSRCIKYLETGFLISFAASFLVVVVSIFPPLLDLFPAIPQLVITFLFNRIAYPDLILATLWSQPWTKEFRRTTTTGTLLQLANSGFP